MKIEIDQSGKIEYTSKPTVLAFSNSNSHSIIVSASNKQYLQRVYRKAGKSKILMIKTFAVLVYLLVKNEMKDHNDIIIDREYVGYERVIKEYILQFCQKDNITINKSSIHFANIGKKSRAHVTAYQAYSKRKADKKVSTKEILKLIL